MSWAKRINNTSYVLGTVANLAIANYGGYPNVAAMCWLSYVVLAACGNHYFTVKTLNGLIQSRMEDGDAPDNKKLMLYLLLKTLFLASAFLCLLVYSRDYVLQGLLVYIFQLIILFLSIKNIGKFFKKGSPS